MDEKSYEELKKDYDALLSRYMATQQTLANLEKLLEEANKKVEILQAEKRQWDEQKVLQNQIIHQQLQNNDLIIRKLQDELIALKQRFNIKD